MKIPVILFAILLYFSTLLSNSYKINLNLSDGTKVTYEISDINKIDFSDITGVEDLEKIQHLAKTFKLLQNYPNPFNPSTTIPYEITKKGEVEINIYDLSGRMVKNILKKTQTAGTHQVVWDGKNQNGVRVSSGFYVYSVKYNNMISSKKMILIK